jgi:hypothetical protein
MLHTAIVFIFSVTVFVGSIMQWSKVLDGSRYDIIKCYLLLGIGFIYSLEVCLFNLLWI